LLQAKRQLEAGLAATNDCNSSHMICLVQTLSERAILLGRLLVSPAFFTPGSASGDYRHLNFDLFPFSLAW